MKREYRVVIERDSEGYFVGSIPSLHGCHTQAKSLDELMIRIREAIELCLEVEGESEGELDFVVSMEYSIDEQTVPISNEIGELKQTTRSYGPAREVMRSSTEARVSRMDSSGKLTVSCKLPSSLFSRHSSSS